MLEPHNAHKSCRNYLTTLNIKYLDAKYLEKGGERRKYVPNSWDSFKKLAFHFLFTVYLRKILSNL
jgi:hypothetical protein